MRVIVLLAMFCAPLSAAALTAEAGRFARNFAMLAYGQKRCPHLRVNELMLAQAVTAIGLAKGALEPGGEVSDEAKAQMGKLDAAFGQQSDERFCAFIEDGFGPDGTIASGFIKRR